LKGTNVASEPEVPPEDWDEDTMNLFEWVGMVSLGAQRLQAHDQVNPFVAVYEPPAPSRIGDVTHLSWRGLLLPEFVQSIVDVAW
jgi:ribonuclease P/MRP protein subunit RPP40